MIPKTEPTVAEKISATMSLAELEGFRYGLQFQGLLTDENLRLLAVRKVELQKRHAVARP